MLLDREVSYAYSASEVIILREARMRTWLWLVLVACSTSKPLPPPPPPAPKPACLADQIPALTSSPEHDASCQADTTCEAKCTDGVADACMIHAYAVQRDGGDAAPLYARACKLGLAVGCTNYGAWLWLGNIPVPPANEICARRLFEASCRAREPFGCGMVGRMMAENARTPAEQEAARRHFDATCNVYGAMSCRMYALHLERGQLGEVNRATVRALLLRACESGDPDACDHDTAAETFHNGGE
jgi:hypothetical protein